MLDNEQILKQLNDLMSDHENLCVNQEPKYACGDCRRLTSYLLVLVTDVKSQSYFQGVDAGMAEAKNNALYYFAESGRKTIKYKDLDKLFINPVLAKEPTHHEQ